MCANMRCIPSGSRARHHTQPSSASAGIENTDRARVSSPLPTHSPSDACASSAGAAVPLAIVVAASPIIGRKDRRAFFAAMAHAHRYAVGAGLVLLVDVLWTASNFLASAVLYVAPLTQHARL